MGYIVHSYLFFGKHVQEKLTLFIALSRKKNTENAQTTMPSVKWMKKNNNKLLENFGNFRINMLFY